MARAALYQLLSQALAYPSHEVVEALMETDLPQAREAVSHLPSELATALSAFDEHLRDADTGQLQDLHRTVFSHVMSADCPPCETFYTARHVFQETQELSDIGGFYRAFSLEMAEKERLDHICVELEFMHFLTYKESYAFTHHGSEKARFCRGVQRQFMQDHLGRWAIQFARNMARKADGGYLGSVAALTEAFASAETDFLRAQPGAATPSPDWRTMSPQDFTCPAGEGCQ
jgi:DMSO reductase family type II enzyme chaperone